MSCEIFGRQRRKEGEGRTTEKLWGEREEREEKEKRESVGEGETETRPD